LSAAPDQAATPGRIVFSHANGFPAGTYRQTFELWRAAGWKVSALPRIGHDPAFPVTLNWPHLRDELVAFIERESGGEPAMLVGHSLGGFLSVLVATERPDLARGVVLLDSPIVAGWRAGVLRWAQGRPRLMERYSPSKVSRRRRIHWSDADEAFAHLSGKPAFARWAPGVLRDYLDAGLVKDGRGVHLAFDRDIESAIYDHLPHHIGRLVRERPLRCPLAFIGGTESDEIRRVGLAETRRLAAGAMRRIEGSHLFPMERPRQTAETVLEILAGFGRAR
jgi:pimeloyl-ACP methyl ester carboxylesterase